MQSDILCIAHAIKAAFTAAYTLCGYKGIKALLCCHTISTCLRFEVLESAARQSVRKHCIKHRIAVFDKPCIIKRNAKFCERNHHLRRTFCGFFPLRCKSAVCKLLLRHKFERFFHRCIYIFSVGVFSKCLQSHCRNITVGTLARERPSAVGKLLFQNMVNIFIAYAAFIITAIKGNQRKYRTVYALPHGFFKIEKRFCKVISAYICCILANSGQRDNHTGILCVFA